MRHEDLGLLAREVDLAVGVAEQVLDRRTHVPLEESLLLAVARVDDDLLRLGERLVRVGDVAQDDRQPLHCAHTSAAPELHPAERRLVRMSPGFCYASGVASSA